jgi:hypothetical protein
MTNGMMFGINEHMSILRDLKRYNMLADISRKAQNILSHSPLMMKRLPSKNVTLVPVKETVYLEVSNSLSVIVLKVSRIIGSLRLPTSAILMEIRVD